MNAVVFEEAIRIPGTVQDLESFRRWARSGEFPERGQISYLKDEVWVDMSPEDLFAHNRIKGEYGFVLHGLAKKGRLGQSFHDRALLTNIEAGLSTEPDGIFVSWEALRSGRIELVKGTEGYVEIAGTPDMVLEVVSPTSRRKDKVVLRELYRVAGIPEYWLVDATTGRLSFDILRRGSHGYAATRHRAGWLKSGIFGKSFRLTAKKDELGYPEYFLVSR